MEQNEQILSTQRIYEGRIVNLRVDTVKMPSGRNAKREIVEHAGAICVIPVHADGRVVLVRQFRLPTGGALLEIPAGGIEKDEKPIDAAQRELGEECGLFAAKLTPLFQCFLAPGYSTELIHCFLAEELSPTQAHPDEDEDVEVEARPLIAWLPLIESGEIQDAKTIAGLMTLFHRQNGS